MKKTILTLAVAAAGMTFASAASADFCGDYANGMVNINSQSARLGCNLTHPNWQGHYSWCLRNPPARVNGALRAWQGRLNQCRPGSPASSGTPKLGPSCGALYRKYWSANGTKSFAVSQDGQKCGMADYAYSKSDAIQKAIGLCYSYGGVNCRTLNTR